MQDKIASHGSQGHLTNDKRQTITGSWLSGPTNPTQTVVLQLHSRGRNAASNGVLAGDRHASETREMGASADVLARVCASETEARQCLLTQVLCPHADVAHVFECGLHVPLPRLRNVRHCKGTARHARVTGANHVSKRACVQGRPINAQLWPDMGIHVSAAAESAESAQKNSLAFCIFLLFLAVACRRCTTPTPPTTAGPRCSRPAEARGTPTASVP
jgi:hypothetical protein